MFNCDNSTVLKVVLLIKNIIDLIKIFGPILLIIWIIIDIVKLVSGDMEDEKVKKTKKRIINRFIAVIAIFIIPIIINNTMTSLGKENVESTTCWVNANEKYIEKKKNEEEKLDEAKIKADKEARELTEKQRREKALKERKAIAFNKPSEGGNANGGGILIIAGHAYAPECLACGDCRGKTASGYAEEEETRSLALSIKKALLAKGINAVIANQILIGDENDSRMDASFLCSRGENGSYGKTFKSLEKKGYWDSFSHVIEIHFNAANTSASGTMIMTSGGQTSKVTEIDKKILNIISGYTGSNKGVQGFSQGTLGNWNYFKNTKNKSMTYIEVEFYDNKSAMEKYKRNQEKIAESIADTLKKEGY